MGICIQKVYVHICMEFLLTQLKVFILYEPLQSIQNVHRSPEWKRMGKKLAFWEWIRTKWWNVRKAKERIRERQGKEGSRKGGGETAPYGIRKRSNCALKFQNLWNSGKPLYFRPKRQSTAATIYTPIKWRERERGVLLLFPSVCACLALLFQVESVERERGRKTFWERGVSFISRLQLQ